MSVRTLELIDSEPAPQPDADTVRLRIGIATQDMKSMNTHFGSARKFALYEVTPDNARFLGAVGFGDVSDESGSHKTEGDDRITPKVEALTGCDLLFVMAIGGPAAARVVAAKIHPVKLSKPEAITSVIEKVQTMMKGNPPPWLRKVMGAGRQRSMAFLDEEV